MLNTYVSQGETIARQRVEQFLKLLPVSRHVHPISRPCHRASTVTGFRGAGPLVHPVRATTCAGCLH